MPNNSSKLSSAGSYYVNVKKYIAHFVPNVSRISSLAKLLTYFICNWFWLFHNNKILDHTDLQVVSIELVQLSHLRIFLCENMEVFSEKLNFFRGWKSHMFRLFGNLPVLSHTFISSYSSLPGKHCFFKMITI